MEASKALAAIQGRDFITPEDIKKVAAPVLAHRIILTPEREMEGLTAHEVVRQIVESIEIPTGIHICSVIMNICTLSRIPIPSHA